jgi:threonine/homoserine/homoserine lactone efflux protein
MEVISLIFVLTSVMIILIPGQDMVLVLSRSLVQGKKAGIITALGVSIGLIGHTLLAALGLGAILMASEWIFNAIKIIGAVYLIYIGYQLLSAKDSSIDTQKLKKVSYKKMFLQGAICNISNPKITIFYFSYLPQFVIPNAISQTYQLLVLGTTFALLTFIIKGPLGYLGGMFSFWISTREFVLKAIFKTSGAILILLGIKLALEEN